MTSTPTPLGRCPCGGEAGYDSCCGPLHAGAAAPDPERLMRSRYAAYSLGLADYILETTHPRSPHRRPDTKAWLADVRRFCEQTEFVGLVVLDRSSVAPATVTFQAMLRQGGRLVPMHERSLFERHRGRWCYVDAVV